MTNLSSLLATEPEGQLTTGDAALFIRMRDALREMAKERDGLQARANAALDYMKFNTGDTQHLRNAEEILTGNMDSDGKWIVRSTDNG